MAIKLMDRIVTNSELKEIWEGTDSFDEWCETVRDLERRLKESLEIPSERQRVRESGITVEDVCQQAAVLVGEQKYEDALAKYDQALVMEPKEQMVYMGRAICHLWLQDYERVIESINKALSLGDPVADAYHLRSQAFFHLGKYKNAIADLSLYLRSRPQHTESYLIRGLAYYNLAQYDSAIADFTTITERGNSDHLYDAISYRAICYDWVGRPDLAGRDRQTAKQLEAAMAHPP
jgi:tetratricopeptide (TPR) repeat protein